MDIKSIARQIAVAAKFNGGSVTRGELQDAFRAIFSFRPTNGEISDAIRFLRSTGNFKIEIPERIDFRSTKISIIEK